MHARVCVRACACKSVLRVIGSLYACDGCRPDTHMEELRMHSYASVRGSSLYTYSVNNSDKCMYIDGLYAYVRMRYAYSCLDVRLATGYQRGTMAVPRHVTTDDMYMHAHNREKLHSAHYKLDGC